MGLITATRQQPFSLRPASRKVGRDERLVQREPHGLYDVGHAHDGPYAYDGSDDGFRQRLGLGQLGQTTLLGHEENTQWFKSIRSFSVDLGKKTLAIQRT